MNDENNNDSQSKYFPSIWNIFAAFVNQEG